MGVRQAELDRQIAVLRGEVRRAALFFCAEERFFLRFAIGPQSLHFSSSASTTCPAVRPCKCVSLHTPSVDLAHTRSFFLFFLGGGTHACGRVCARLCMRAYARPRACACSYHSLIGRTGPSRPAYACIRAHNPPTHSYRCAAPSAPRHTTSHARVLVARKSAVRSSVGPR